MKKKTQHVVLILVFLTLLISACSSNQEANRVNEDTGTITNVIHGQPTTTPELRDTTTISPVAISSTNTVTPEPSSSPTILNPPDIIGTVVAMGDPYIHSSFLSPDGEWEIVAEIHECVKVGLESNAYGQLKLINVASSSEKVIDSQLRNCGGTGAFGLGGLYWSPNSQYFFFTTAREGQPGGCGYWMQPINRYDIIKENTEHLGGGVLSKDSAYLATWQGQDLVVWHLNEGEIGRSTALIDNFEMGSIAWSPDSQSLVYLQVESYCPLSGQSSIFRLDFPYHEPYLLFSSEDPVFGEVLWDEENELTLKFLWESNQVWTFNLYTKVLKVVP